MRAAAGISHAPGTRAIWISSRLRPAAQQGIERALEQPLGDDRIPSRDHDGEAHAFGGEIAFHGDRLVLQRIVPRPEGECMPGLRLGGKHARFPMRVGDLREAHRGLNAFAAKPCGGGLVHGVERGHFDADDRRSAASFRRQIPGCRWAPGTMRRDCCLLVPATSGCEAQGAEKTRQAIVGGCASGGAQKGDSLDHDLILSCGNEGVAMSSQATPVISGSSDPSLYVVERGLTAICVAGTEPALGAVFRQPGSEPGAHAGSLRSICCLSVRVVVSM